MGTTLDNGIYLPDEGERNCYDGLAGNWVALDNHLGSTNIHVTINDKQAWDGHVADSVKHVTAEDKAKWNTVTSKADASALNAHTGNTTIHVTAEDKTKWDAVTSKAQDSDVVHKSGKETIGGEKTFTNNVSLKSLTAEYTVTGSSISVTYSDKNNLLLAQNKLGNYQSGISYNKFSIYAYDSNNQLIDRTLTYSSTSSTLATAYLRPDNNNIVSLGTSGNRWSKVYATNYYYGNDNVEFSQKFVTTDTAQTVSGNKTFSSINGVEPSSLSLPVAPSSTSFIDISSYITDMTGGVANNFTPPANGYITFSATGTQVQIFSGYGLQSKFSIQSGLTIRGYHPVLKNEAIKIYVVARSIEFFRFIPCQGNV